MKKSADIKAPAAFAALGVGVLVTAAVVQGLAGMRWDSASFDYGALRVWPASLPLDGLPPRELASVLVRAIVLAPAALVFAWGWRRLRLKPITIPPARVTAIAAAGLVLAVALAVFHQVPIVDDEATYRMQADLLAQGRLADPPLAPELRWHREPFTIFTPQATTGKYLFGEPLVLAAGVVTGLPVLAHALLAALTLWLFFLALGGKASKMAAAAALLLALSPQFVFTSATLQSQPTALFAIVALVACHERGWGFVGGLALGLCIATRPQVAAPCVLALLLWSRQWRFWLKVAAGALPFVVAVLAYDHAITGDWLTLPGAFYSDERYGFGAVESVGGGYTHTPLRGLAIAAAVLARMNGWALGWPWSLLAPAAWLWLGRPHAKAVAPWAWIAGATFLFQLGYYFGGLTETGPAYHFAALPFFAATGAVALDEARSRPWVPSVITAFLLLGTTTFWLEQAVRLRALTEAIAAPMTASDGREPALVFLERSEVGGHPAGTVHGVPVRVRREDTPVVYFPRPVNPAATEALRARWSGRDCRYVYWSDGAYRVTDCDRMQQLGAQFDRLEPPWF